MSEVVMQMLRTERQHPLSGLLDRDLPTPAYVYDLAEVRRNVLALRSALPEGCQVFYSLKANAHPVLLSELKSTGVRAEVCSSGELIAALHAGWSPDDILVTGPGKRDVDLLHALSLGVSEYSVDSPAGLAQIDRLATLSGHTARCLLRVNDDQPVHGQGLTMTGVPSQFGADLGWIQREPEQFRGGPGAPVTGLHLYMGTNLTEVTDLLTQFRRTLTTAMHVAGLLDPTGQLITTFDLGGGFGAPFAQVGRPVELSSMKGPLVAMIEETVGTRARVCFESGRYLVGTAGSLISRVLDVKWSQGKKVVVLESGINHLGGMSGLRRLPPLSPQLLDRSSPEDQEPTMICGPLCTPLDVWSRSHATGQISIGEPLLVPNVGAYGLSASLVAFLGHDLPSEVVIDSDLRGDVILSSSRLGLHRTPC